jgi:hypothetical protein
VTACWHRQSRRKSFIRRRGRQRDDDLYDARVKDLGELIDHHAGEEESELFPEAKKSDIDIGRARSADAGAKESAADWGHESAA